MSDQAPRVELLEQPIGGYRIEILFQGFPGKGTHHGGLGWSTVALLRGAGRVILIDTGAIGFRKELLRRLADKGVKPADVTDLILTHGHHDHMINYPMFAAARLYIGARELDWALTVDLGVTPVPDFYVRELARDARLTKLQDGEEVVPGITAHLMPGHTPGCLVFVLKGEDRDVIFTGDAVKCRAELMSRQADMTLDSAQSRASIEKIWSLWKARAGSILIPGHDAPMVVKDGDAVLLCERIGGIAAMFGDALEDVTTTDVSGCCC